MSQILLYLDEDVHPTLATILRERGFDVLTTVEAKMMGKSDREQLEFATSKNRTILTHNVKDYVRLAQQYTEQDRTHSGIIVSNQLPLKELLQRTLKLLTKYADETMLNRFEWLSAYR